MKIWRTLIARTFLAFLAVALLTALVGGMIVRYIVSNAFEGYVTSLPNPSTMMPGRHMGRVMLGAAEQTFLGGVNHGMIVAALVAFVVAAIAALLLARSLSAPLARLEHAALSLADGNLEHRVEVTGPTEVERLAGAFNAMAASLEEAEELRRRLVADVAHELRNPLAAARAQAEGMAEGILATDTPRLESVLEDLEDLSRLVNDLQELSIAEAGGLAYEPVRFDMCALAERDATRFASSMPDGGVNVRAECTGPLEIEADERRISQALRNMIANAVRHTAEGEVVVSCAPRQDGMIEVLVSDTGEGIAPEALPYIFERFYRADAARARDTGGSGIGLALARRIVRDHGGEVFAHSESGHGAVVGFTLPASRNVTA